MPSARPFSYTKTPVRAGPWCERYRSNTPVVRTFKRRVARLFLSYPQRGLYRFYSGIW